MNDQQSARVAWFYYVENLTASLVTAAEELIAEVEKLGGMTKAVESGMPKLRIEEAAARRQARVDRGEDVIVGVNKYKTDDRHEIDILDVDNTKVRESQISRLNRVKSTRDAAAVSAALEALAQAAVANHGGNQGNLLELSVAAMRARATLGEVSEALERVFGRHKAEIRSVAGVYGAAYRDDPDFQMIQRKVQDFAREEAEGRASWWRSSARTAMTAGPRS